MKKILLSIAILLVLVVIFLTQFSFQIGSFHIGRQITVKTKQAKDFEKSHFYNQYYSQDNLLVINIWATWCVPCVGEMPELNEVKATFKDENIKFLSLSVDNDSLKLVNFAKTNKFKYDDITFDNLKYRDAILNTLEGKEVGNKRSLVSVPITYLLKNRKVVAKIDGTIEKNELVRLINMNK